MVSVTHDSTQYQALLETANTHWSTQVQQSAITTADGIIIRYARLYVDNPAAIIVIATGRAESYLKYKDLSLQLNLAGYSVLLYDHRGQGLSGRMLSDPLKGYVKSFNDYANDLKLIFDTLIAPHPRQKTILLSHSVGGTVAALYAIQHPQDFDALVTSSPLLGLPGPFVQKGLAHAIGASESVLCRWLGREPGYIPTIKRYTGISFDNNTLTQSQDRFNNMASLIKEHPGIALGKPTIHWVREAYRAFACIFDNIDAIKARVLLLQAGADKVICNKAQKEFCQRLNTRGHTNTLLVIENARHELLNEAAPFHDSAVAGILAFLASVCALT